MPANNVVATPNTVLATPFRSQRTNGTPTNSFNTPTSVRGQAGALVPTPVRDKLSINPEEVLEGPETPALHKQVRNLKRSLRIFL